MKKIFFGLAVVVALGSLPHQASASWWSDFIDWIRNAPPSEVEKIKDGGPTFTVPKETTDTQVNQNQPQRKVSNSSQTPSPTVSATPIPRSAIVTKVDASLLSSLDDRAGAWNNFGPGVGNVNKNGADWNWSLTISTSNEPTRKEVKRITIIHNTQGEVWSTGYSRYLSDGTDLYGYDEHPYPLVVEWRDKGVTPNTTYDQNLFLGSFGGPGTVVGNYKMYGQKESANFTGGTLVVEFTDGTSVKTKISAGNSAYERAVKLTSEPVNGRVNYLNYTVTSSIAFDRVVFRAECNKNNVLVDAKAGMECNTDNSIGFTPRTSYTYPIVWSSLDGQNHTVGVTVKVYKDGNLVGTDRDAITVVASSDTVKESKLTITCFATPSNPKVGQAVNWQVSQSGGRVPYSYQWRGTDQLTGQSSLASKVYSTSGTKNAEVTVSTPTQTVVSVCKTYISNTESISTARITYPIGTTKYIIGNSYPIKHYGGSNGEKARFEFINAITGETYLIRDDVSLTTTNESTIFFEVPTILQPGTYYVRMTRTSDGSKLSSTGEIIVTKPEPAISVTSPFVNQSYLTGGEMKITYDSRHFSTGTPFEIKLAKRALVAGSTIEPIKSIVSGLGSSGTYTWTIPTSQAVGDNYLILVCAYGSSTDKCGHSPVFKINTLPTPTATNGSVSRSSQSSIANVFYSIGDALDTAF